MQIKTITYIKISFKTKVPIIKKNKYPSQTLHKFNTINNTNRTLTEQHNLRIKIMINLNSYKVYVIKVQTQNQTFFNNKKISLQKW